MPTLIVTFMSGPEDGSAKVVPLDGNNAVVTIGRLDDCTIAIPYDPDASRKHAQLTYRNGEWWLNDLGSANGTFMGEFAQSRKISAAEKIIAGQIFRVGLTRFKLANETSQVDNQIVGVQTA